VCVVVVDSGKENNERIKTSRLDRSLGITCHRKKKVKVTIKLNNGEIEVPVFRKLS
jgi:hypothetical protein